MGRSNKELGHSGFNVEDGHGGMKRNRSPENIHKMDMFTRASMDIMRTNSPEARRKRSIDRTTRNTQNQIQNDAQDKINRQSTPPPTGMDGGGAGRGRGGGGAMAVGAGAGAGGGRLKRGTVIVSDLE